MTPEQDRAELKKAIFHAAAEYKGCLCRRLSKNIDLWAIGHKVGDKIDEAQILAIAHAVCDVMAEVCPLLPPKE